MQMTPRSWSASLDLLEILDVASFANQSNLRHTAHGVTPFGLKNGLTVSTETHEQIFPPSWIVVFMVRYLIMLNAQLTHEIKPRLVKRNYQEVFSNGVKVTKKPQHSGKAFFFMLELLQAHVLLFQNVTD